jgi:hypothetical protein
MIVVCDDDSTFGHHRNQVSIAQTVGDVPTNAELNELGLEPASAINRVARYFSCHLAPRKEARIL